MSGAALISLGDVAEFVRGITFKPDDVINLSEPGAIACMRTKNVQSDLELADLWAIPSSFVKRSEQFLREGDILVSTANSWNLVGKCCWVPKLQQKSTLGGFISALRSTSDKLDSRYLYHWFSLGPVQALVRNCARKTTNIANLSFDQCLALKLALPPLDEQKLIATILDQADELRRKRQRAIDRLNQLGQAIFHEMFGDPKSNPRELPWVKLGEIADFYSGNSLPEGESFTGQSDGHLLLKVSDLNHELNQQDIVCAANWSAVPGSRAGTCPPNSLIFPKRGGAIGTNKKRWLRRSAILDPNLMGVHPNETELTMSFLNGWFQTFNLTDIASGSSVPQLNKQDLAPLDIALPPIDEQLEYARRMEALGRARQGFIRAADNDSKLFSVLQHRAFRGEL